jgi:acylphosphatase
VGKKAKLKKPMVTELTRRGLVEVVGWSEFTQRVHLELNVDGRVRELLDAKHTGVKITPVAAEQRARWLAQVTQAAFNLVAKHVP